MSGGTFHDGAPADLRSAQARCDSIQTDYRSDPQPVAEGSIRREDAPPLDPALVPCDDQLRLRLAEELDHARKMLDTMGDELTADMGLVMRHGVALQSIDIVGQMLGHIAAVTRSAEPERAVERIGMCELRARLLRKSAL